MDNYEFLEKIGSGTHGVGTWALFALSRAFFWLQPVVSISLEWSFAEKVFPSLPLLRTCSGQTVWKVRRRADGLTLVLKQIAFEGTSPEEQDDILNEVS